MLLPRKLACLQTRDTHGSAATLEWSTGINRFWDARWTCMVGLWWMTKTQKLIKFTFHICFYYYFLRFVFSHAAEVELICWYTAHRIYVEMLV